MSDWPARCARWVRFAPAGYSGVLSLLIAGPLLGPGYLLLRDAVSTPRSYATDSALGLGAAAPRAVPQDALLAALSAVIDGGLIVKAILVVALWAAGYGAAVLARELLRVSTGPQLVAVTVALWNPYVAERLLQGHWSLLTGYAALPWTVLAAYRIRQRSAPNAAPSNKALNKPDADRPTSPHPTPGNKALNQPNADRPTSPHPTPSNKALNKPDADRPIAPTDTDRADPTAIATPRNRTPAPAAVGRRARFHRANRKDTTRSTASACAALAACFAAAGLTPTGALLAGCTAVVLIGRRNLLGTFALLLAASAPWLTATALSGAGSEPSDPAGIAAFAARAEPALGTLGSLAGLGGIWNADSVPTSRTTPLAMIGTALLLILVATGIRAIWTKKTSTTGTIPPRSPAATPTAPDTESATATTYSTPAQPKPNTATSDNTRTQPTSPTDIEPGTTVPTGRATHVESEAATAHSTKLGAETTATDRANIRIRRVLLILAAAAVLLPASGATSWGMSVLEWLVTNVPGTGLLRDTQKYVALAMPAYALCAAAGCRTVAMWFTPNASNEPPARNSRTTAMSLTAALFIALLILPLFDLAWGVGNQLRPVHYPVSWQRVADRIDGPGDIAVLPGGMFRKFPYSGRAPVLDPAPRMLPRDVLQTGELPVHGRTVAGEGAKAREVESILLHGGSAQQLTDLGVGWVLVEHTTPGPLGESKTTLTQLTTVYTDSELALYRVPGTTDRPAESHTQRVVAYAAHLIWAALLVGGLLLTALLRPPS
ncbi:hypothetical protein ACQP0C_40080 [Nocardia sp. CA-129566]|uniref:hypothetical protein n=1 Tax=Nocardia sp. CA-129566 TaxID=3239976 RepID=UPI003D980D9E